MIGRLKGVVDSIGRDTLILDVGGVGYEVACSARLLGRVTSGAPLVLAVETYVREDAIRLFGFASEAERAWFRLLQNVQGVGAKVALAVIGTLEPQELASAIALQDRAQVARAPGVGPKVAARIVAELRDKAPALMAAGGLSMPEGAAAAVADAGSPMGDAVSALINLGYAPQQASAAIAAASRSAGDAASTEALIRAGLRELAK